MGAASSRLQQALKSPDAANLSPRARYYGFENFGNTCYCNAVLQALYHCSAFRSRLRAYASELNSAADADRSLLLALAHLFDGISAAPLRSGVVAPETFLRRLRRSNQRFATLQQQDAHEFLNFLLNDVSASALALDRSSSSSNGDDEGGGEALPRRSFVQELFEGVLTNETRCLRCESITSRDEAFLDLSVDVTQNSSISQCFANFCAVERLAGGNKFFCDACNTLQEAHKSLHVKRAPPVLVLHLKRFKFVDRYNCHKKLTSHVAFPFDLRLSVGGGAGSCRYSLLAVVVHRGSGPNSGHYFSYVRSESNWLLFNDEHIDLVDRATIQAAFGRSRETVGATCSTAYILVYEQVAHRQSSSLAGDSSSK
jgi:ubiquitin carboxyl-terminal hydrolase 12/46